MEVIVRHAEHVTIIELDGSLDGLTADRLVESLAAHLSDGRLRLVADFARVHYTSSAGLRSLLIGVKESRRAGGDLRLAALQPNVEKVLKLTGFTSILRIFGDVEEAIVSFGPPA